MNAGLKAYWPKRLPSSKPIFGRKRAILVAAKNPNKQIY
jgi:hypothetical protein